MEFNSGFKGLINVSTIAITLCFSERYGN